mmetsp:Transcript_14712/g.37586  ORF Transcript_14712/g.37586 Transcript_14712/m.37586 type:complete len:360 (-) Transcript_14712:56-1135(-)
MPAVFVSPIRPDLVHAVHTNMAKNHRQAYAVNVRAGHQHSAESWGTGRAVSRIPRVSGGGTHRAGQAAFGNMCRKGRMFAPTKTWRKWHRQTNLTMRRQAVCSALAASALPSLVMARGHHVDQVPELPLVVKGLEDVRKTKNAATVLATLGASADVQKVRDSKQIRSGKGKMRNRRYVMRKGPLVIYGDDSEFARAFRNIPGVELASVDRLNLLQLAPGGHLGRFTIFTASAFAKLNDIFGTFSKLSKSKKGFHLPRPIMANPDVARLINSEEVQKVVKPAVKQSTFKVHKKNPLKNLGALVKLNPFALKQRREALLAAESATKRREAGMKKARKLNGEERRSVKTGSHNFYKFINEEI